MPGEEPLPDLGPDEGAVVYDAIIEEIGNLRAAYERDPDPAEDHPEAESDEPSNDWPGASR
ncbi:hypothetical protein [Rhizobium ruizarguesonis]|uniref:hypothetical protein n=1 Tax=Rhizobium ruizarguesonis TaxID=2081791 RepID=UPI0031BA4458